MYSQIRRKLLFNTSVFYYDVFNITVYIRTVGQLFSKKSCFEKHLFDFFSVNGFFSQSHHSRPGAFTASRNSMSLQW